MSVTSQDWDLDTLLWKSVFSQHSLQHVRLPFWQVTQPTINTENPTNTNKTLGALVIPNSAVYVISERFPLYTPGGNFYKPNLDRRLNPLPNNVRKKTLTLK